MNKNESSQSSLIVLKLPQNAKSDKRWSEGNAQLNIKMTERGLKV